MGKLNLFRRNQLPQETQTITVPIIEDGAWTGCIMMHTGKQPDEVDEAEFRKLLDEP